MWKQLECIHIQLCSRVATLLLILFFAGVNPKNRGNKDKNRSHVHVLLGFLNVLFDFRCDVEAQFLWH